MWQWTVQWRLEKWTLFQPPAVVGVLAIRANLTIDTYSKGGNSWPTGSQSAILLKLNWSNSRHKEVEHALLIIDHYCISWGPRPATFGICSPTSYNTVRVKGSRTSLRRLQSLRFQKSLSLTSSAPALKGHLCGLQHLQPRRLRSNPNLVTAQGRIQSQEVTASDVTSVPWRQGLLWAA